MSPEGTTPPEDEKGQGTATATPPSAPPQEEASTNGSSSSDEFREEQLRVAATQNLEGDNVVPERRPIASQVVDDYHQSDTYLKLREEGSTLAQEEPMDQSAYDKADADSQRKKAAKAERQEVMLPASFVEITKDGAHKGRPAAVLEVHYKDEAAERRAALGTPEARFAEVDHYIVRTRDDRSDLVEVKPDEVRPLRPSKRFRGNA